MGNYSGLESFGAGMFSCSRPKWLASPRLARLPKAVVDNVVVVPNNSIEIALHRINPSPELWGDLEFTGWLALLDASDKLSFSLPDTIPFSQLFS